jgi:hypothetical protein
MITNQSPLSLNLMHRPALVSSSYAASPIWLFFLLFSPVFCQFAHSESELSNYHSSKHGISFRYDSSLKEESPTLSQSIVVLKSSENGYPSFNILIAAETYSPIDFNPESYKERIISDYSAVGITDAHNVRTYAAPVAGLQLLTSELRYQFKEQTLISSVTLVPHSKGKHLILTYTDLAEQFYRRKQTREQIISSLTLAESESQPTTTEATDSSHWVILAALTVLAVIIGLVALRLRTKS